LGSLASTAVIRKRQWNLLHPAELLMSCPIGRNTSARSKVRIEDELISEDFCPIGHAEIVGDPSGFDASESIGKFAFLLLTL